jgi:hypothetical protein
MNQEKFFRAIAVAIIGFFAALGLVLLLMER